MFVKIRRVVGKKGFHSEFSSNFFIKFSIFCLSSSSSAVQSQDHSSRVYLLAFGIQ